MKRRTFVQKTYLLRKSANGWRIVKPRRTGSGTSPEKYGVCGFVAYLNKGPTGLAEFPQVSVVPYLKAKPKDTIFVLCA